MTGGRASTFNLGKPKSSSTLLVCYFLSLLAYLSFFNCSSLSFSASVIPLATTSTNSLVTGKTGAGVGSFFSSTLTSSFGLGTGTYFGVSITAALTSTTGFISGIGSGFSTLGASGSIFLIYS